MIERFSRDTRFRRLRAEPNYTAPVNSANEVVNFLDTRWEDPLHPTPRRNIAGIAIPVAASIGARATLEEASGNLSKTLVLAPAGAAVGRLALETLVYRDQNAFKADTRVSHDRGRGFWRSVLPFIANAAEKKVSGWILKLEGPNNSRDRAHQLLVHTQLFNPANTTEVMVAAPKPAIGAVAATPAIYEPVLLGNGMARPNATAVYGTNEMRRIIASPEETEAYAKEALHYVITTDVLRAQGAERREEHFGAGNLAIKRQRLIDITQKMIELHVQENVWNNHLKGITNPSVLQVFQAAQTTFNQALDTARHDFKNAQKARSDYLRTHIPTLPTPADRAAGRAIRASVTAQMRRPNLLAEQQTMLLRIKQDLLEREQLARTTQTAAFSAIAALKTIPMKILLVDPIVSTIGRVGNLFSGIANVLNKPDIFGIGGNGGGSHTTVNTALSHHHHHAGRIPNSHTGNETGQSAINKIVQKNNSGITINTTGNNDTTIVNVNGKGVVEPLSPKQTIPAPVQPKITESFYVFDAHDPHPTANHLPADGNTSAYKQWVVGEAYKSMHIPMHTHLTPDQQAELKAREDFINAAARKLNPELIQQNSISHEGVITVEAPSVDMHDAATINKMTEALQSKNTSPVTLQRDFWNNWKTQPNQPFASIADNRPLSQNVFDATTQLNGPRYMIAPQPFFNHIDMNAATKVPQITDFTRYMPDAFKRFMTQNGLTDFQALLSQSDTLSYDQKMKVMNYIRMTMYHTPHNLQSQLKQILEQMKVSVPAAA